MHITTEDIQKRVHELGTQITKDYKDKTVVVIAVLTGGIVFAVDLIRCMDVKLRLDTIRARSKLEGTVSLSGHANLLHIRDQHVLVVEDIVDTGLTIKEITKALLQYNPASIQVASLLLKPNKFHGQRPAYVGFEIEDKFVYGYGMDLDQFKRNSPYIKAIPTNMMKEGK